MRVPAKHALSSGHINHTKRNATMTNKAHTFYKNSMCNPSIHLPILVFYAGVFIDLVTTVLLHDKLISDAQKCYVHG